MRFGSMLNSLRVISSTFITSCSLHFAICVLSGPGAPAAAGGAPPGGRAPGGGAAPGAAPARGAGPAPGGAPGAGPAPGPGPGPGPRAPGPGPGPRAPGPGPMLITGEPHQPVVLYPIGATST